MGTLAERLRGIDPRAIDTPADPPHAAGLGASRPHRRRSVATGRSRDVEGDRRRTPYRRALLAVTGVRGRTGRFGD
jgi:hypothetical protein